MNTMKDEPKAGLLHQPEALESLAKQLREEADRAEARAKALERGTAKAEYCSGAGCWTLLSTCIMLGYI